jgi:N-dimethylarginine dimethylaminohydrolase
MQSRNDNRKSFCLTEYDQLKEVLLCQPHYIRVREELNMKQKAKSIDVEAAIEQHRNFVEVLNNFGIETILLPNHTKYPEQVFTRDIGFTLGQTIFVAEMAESVRQGEEKALKLWLEEEGISYFNLVRDHIEGGDVIIDRDTIYIGLSDRTNQASINHVKHLLSEFNIITIPFKENFLHLDCVFNVLSEEIALIYSNALTREDMKRLSSRYDLIEVTHEEQLSLATNVLSIGSNKVISLPSNKNANEQMRNKGFEVIEVEFSEMIKSGGSFRCCTLPILRG